jgi:hypothetical protein
VAPPGNQAATEKTNINLYHSENPVYSPKVGHASISNFRLQISNLKHSRRRILPMRNAECGVRNLTNY